MSEPGWPSGLEQAASQPLGDGRPQPEALGPVPWEDPEGPRLIGYFLTIGELLRRPAHFFARPALGGPAGPLAFGLITGTAWSLLTLFWWGGWLFAHRHGLEQAADLPPLGLAGGAGFGALAAIMALTPVMVAAKLVLSSLCLWGAASLLGARVGLAPIWRLCCYVTAAGALALVPFIGGVLAVPLMLYLLHQALRGALGMSAGKALGTLAGYLSLQMLASALLSAGLLTLLALELSLLFHG